MIDQKVFGILHTLNSNVGTDITKSEKYYKIDTISNFICIYTCTQYMYIMLSKSWIVPFYNEASNF